MEGGVAIVHCFGEAERQKVEVSDIAIDVKDIKIVANRSTGGYIEVSCRVGG